MAVFYVLAGAYHFINPAFYEVILPGYIPFHTILIYAGGFCEILFGILLIPKSTRQVAAYFIIAMLIVYLWLHVQMLIDYWRDGDRYLWLAVIRIPMQFILIWWAYTFTRSGKNESI